MKKNTLLTTGIICTFVGTTYISSEAATLDFNQDLKGYDATIKTENGKNVLYTKKGKWDLDETSKIYSSKNITIYLDNSQPVDIDSIYAKKNLEFRGKGTLNAKTTDQYGINVGGYLKSFKYTKKGTGEVTAKGSEAGIRVVNEIQSEGGSLKGTGEKYGIWTNNDIKPYYSAKITGIANDGIGIWAYRDIYAWKGAKVYGEGTLSGAYSQIAHIKAEDYGTITGVSTNLNSNYSALHTQKKRLEADDGGRLIEEYKVDPTILEANSFKPTDYTAIRRNMLNFTNYRWTSDNKRINANHHKGLDFTNVTADSAVQGVRVHDYRHEPVDLDDCGLHIVKINKDKEQIVR